MSSALPRSAVSPSSAGPLPQPAFSRRDDSPQEPPVLRELSAPSSAEPPSPLAPLLFAAREARWAEASALWRDALTAPSVAPQDRERIWRAFALAQQKPQAKAGSEFLRELLADAGQREALAGAALRAAARQEAFAESLDVALGPLWLFAQSAALGGFDRPERAPLALGTAVAAARAWAGPNSMAALAEHGALRWMGTAARQRALMAWLPDPERAARPLSRARASFLALAENGWIDAAHAPEAMESLLDRAKPALRGSRAAEAPRSPCSLAPRQGQGTSSPQPGAGAARDESAERFLAHVGSALSLLAPRVEAARVESRRLARWLDALAPARAWTLTAPWGAGAPEEADWAGACDALDALALDRAALDRQAILDEAAATRGSGQSSDGPNPKAARR
jgi:hypothetical protein